MMDILDHILDIQTYDALCPHIGQMKNEGTGKNDQKEIRKVGRNIILQVVVASFRERLGAEGWYDNRSHIVNYFRGLIRSLMAGISETAPGPVSARLRRFVLTFPSVTPSSFAACSSSPLEAALLVGV